MTRGAEPGPDGVLRCPWALSAPDYLGYHDLEWGTPLHGDNALFERLTLEAFQSGLSWLIILRKRPAFRTAFAGFSIPDVAEFDERDVERLLADAGIVRNRSKIEAAVANARVALTIDGGLSAMLWSYAPEVAREAPRTLDDLQGVTPESTALSKDLKKRGMKFVGPTTAHALMQATGMVDDHLVGCVARRS
ncbi:DNA-3-methyladenine glycosylase I [Acidothermaceae bacterium B102]|nr:DNA-3-methyladenine glycosylase I [Acidothermaceae bacterium B102]